MKTLVKPLTNSTIAINRKLINRDERISELNKANRNKIRILKLLLVIISASILITLPESPQISESICNKYHSESVCNVW